MADSEMAAAAPAHPAAGAETESSNGAHVDATPATTAAKAAGERAADDKDGNSGEETFRVNGHSRHVEELRNRPFNNRGRRGGGRGRGARPSDFKPNKEFDNLPESSDQTEIRKQVEFYFSVFNLRDDEFLFDKLDGSANTPVSIKIIANFKRMKHFQPYSAIVAALKDSDMLTVVDDGKYAGPGNEAVKLKVPLKVPQEDTDDPVYPPDNTELFARFRKAAPNSFDASIYAKGFAEDDEQTAIEALFEPYGAVAVRKRREDNGTFKGSVFVEFDSQETLEQFLALDTKPKFNGKDLLIMGKKDYVEMKCAEKGITPDFERERMKGPDNNRRGDSRGRGRGRGNRGGFGSRGGRGGRDDKPRRDYMHDRKRRDRKDADGSDDDRNWNERRERFRSGREDRSSRRDNRRDDESRKSVERDAHGVPVVKDTRVDAELAASKKRKANEEEDRVEALAKKTKIEIKQDE